MGLFGPKKKRGEHRYYLLPGMARSNRHHRRRTHVAAVVFGIVISLIIAVILILGRVNK